VTVPADSRRKLINLGSSWLKPEWWHIIPRMQLRPFYDQGFEEAAGSLRLQLHRECNIYFMKGWVSALEQAAVDDNSELYVLGREYRPFDSGTPENLEEANVEGLKDSETVDDPTALEAVEVSGHQERVQAEEVQDVEKSIFDKEDIVNVDD
jgi:hypothetical protein